VPEIVAAATQDAAGRACERSVARMRPQMDLRGVKRRTASGRLPERRSNQQSEEPGAGKCSLHLADLLIGIRIDYVPGTVKVQTLDAGIDETARSGDVLGLVTEVECPLHPLDADASGPQVLDFVRAVDPEPHQKRGARIFD